MPLVIGIFQWRTFAEPRYHRHGSFRLWLPAFNRIIKHLPEQLNAAAVLVWHVSPYSTSILPEILNRAGKLKANHPVDDGNKNLS